eukprot:gene17520-biopygen5343
MARALLNSWRPVWRETGSHRHVGGGERASRTRQIWPCIPRPESAVPPVSGSAPISGLSTRAIWRGEFGGPVVRGASRNGSAGGEPRGSSSGGGRLRTHGAWGHRPSPCHAHVMSAPRPPVPCDPWGHMTLARAWRGLQATFWLEWRWHGAGLTCDPCGQGACAACGLCGGGEGGSP